MTVYVYSSLIYVHKLYALGYLCVHTEGADLYASKLYMRLR